jgi:hypothetical protein
MDQKPKPPRVLAMVPRKDQASKPSELIQIRGHEGLTLNARRSITILWHNAHQQGVEPGKDYTIALDSLIPGRHKSLRPVEEAILSLMQTILTVRLPDGSVTRVQFLGGNNMSDSRRPSGKLTYSFDKRLVEILQDSSIWGRIYVPELMALSSKYAVSLYENVAQWTGLEHKTSQVLTLEAFREMLGVEPDKYPLFANLSARVIQPSLSEINALAYYRLEIIPIKTAKKVTHVRLTWFPKNVIEHAEAWDEIERNRIGRKARITGKVESVLDPEDE